MFVVCGLYDVLPGSSLTLIALTLGLWVVVNCLLCVCWFYIAAGFLVICFAVFVLV